jgi:hypothetical protein
VAGSTVADPTPPFANFTAADFTTAIFTHSTMEDFITMAFAAALSWFPPSAAGGGVADGVGPITIHTEAITVRSSCLVLVLRSAGHYPYVTQCNTAWQTVPAS